MHEEALFDADATRNATDGYSAGVAVLHVCADYQALENLNTLFTTFTDFLVHAYSVATSNVYDLRLLVLLIDFVNYTLHIQ